jgi:hypothetical protein
MGRRATGEVGINPISLGRSLRQINARDLEFLRAALGSRATSLMIETRVFARQCRGARDRTTTPVPAQPGVGEAKIPCIQFPDFPLVTVEPAHGLRQTPHEFCESDRRRHRCQPAGGSRESHEWQNVGLGRHLRGFWVFTHCEETTPRVTVVSRFRLQLEHLARLRIHRPILPQCDCFWSTKDLAPWEGPKPMCF